MTLKEARCKFTILVATKLIPKAIELGYEVCFDEVTNHQGTGHMPGSLHYFGCACDLNLYRNGTYCSGTESHRALGVYWESLDPNCRWGGYFAKPDGNHYSYAPEELFIGRA